MAFLDSVAFGTDGLLPAIIQDAGTGEVLMLPYMNREALEKTLETGKSHFWSRSRQTLWRKGETSGHEQTVREVRVDCDGDALLLVVDQKGVACHTGKPTCFYRLLEDDTIAEAPTRNPLWEECRTTISEKVHDVITDRKSHPKEGSYTCELFSAGQERILKKISEEAIEVILASTANNKKEVVSEIADLLYHLLVLLGFHDVPLGAVYKELECRYGK